MCGITGYLTSLAESADDLTTNVVRMSTSIAHRGPDDSGVWVDPTHGVALGHRRLSIVDLSPQGHQPMASSCGRFVIVFNGEVYNHLELRDRLAGHQWRGHSDTETLLTCFQRHGIVDTLPMLIGMFAFAVWDRQLHELTLARDRLGEKPLYFGRLACGDLLFGSELKALRAHPRWQCRVDRDALALLLRHSCVPAPWSIYEGVQKIVPGQWVTVSKIGNIRRGTYWSLLDVATRNGRLQDQAVRSDADAIEALDVVLGRAVKGQMMSDVPLGAFLSGGVDSSAIVAQMCKVSTSPVRTFSIGFDDPAYSEAVHAKAIARHLGTRHTELYVTAADALDVIAKLPALYDEPFSDSSQIPTYLVSTMARRDVTVALSGDGGDELFAGYSRYRIAKDVWSILAALPMPLRRTVAKLIRVVSPPTWSTATRWPSKLLPSRMRLSNVGDKLHKFADTVLVARDLAEMYSALVSHWEDPASIVVGANGTSALTPWSSLPSEMRDPVDQMCLADQLSYLPDDILTKVDRAAMGVGLETRVPLLDHRVVEFAWTVPMHQKIRNGQTKWLLRQVLYKSVPHHLIERPKQGFSVPLDRWLRGPLRDWAESLLSADRLRQEGYINPSLVRQRWDEHQSGVRNWQHHLWDVLMFQAWREAVEVPA